MKDMYDKMVNDQARKHYDQMTTALLRDLSTILQVTGLIPLTKAAEVPEEAKHAVAWLLDHSTLIKRGRLQLVATTHEICEPLMRQAEQNAQDHLESAMRKLVGLEPTQPGGDNMTDVTG